MKEYLERKLLNFYIFIDLQGLEKQQEPDIEKEKKAQNQRLRKLMQSAYEIPFYHERFIREGLTPDDFQCAEDPQKFPLLTKQDLRGWMDEECGKEKYKDYFLDTTSGSSGTPTRVLYSPKEKAYNMANWMRVLIKAGYHPYTGKTMSRMSAHSVSAGKKNILQRFGLLRREFIDQYAPEKEVIDCINQSRPDLLYMNKTEIMRLALYSKQNHYEIYHPAFFAPTGEKIDESARTLFKEVLGDGMIDAYGSAETGSCMAKFPGKTYYCIHNDLFVVNLHDEKGRLAENGRIAITPLYKTDIPLINYVVGDEASSAVVDGRRVITEIKGRSNDFIRHEDGRVTTFFMIAPVFSHCSEILQMRLIQKSFRELRIQAVYDSNAKRSRTEVESDIREQLSGRLQSPMDISFEWTDVIQPDKNGKLRLIVSEI